MHADDPRRGGLWGQGKRAAERTMNMPIMLVTPEVSQLEMSALNFVVPEKSSLMSVIPETSQPAMGPYSFSALPGFLLKALTAFCRDSLLVKVKATNGEGGAAGGAAGGADGRGEGQFFFTHLSNFFVHLLHFLSLPAASTPVARRSEMRSRIMSFIVCALCVPARAKAMAHDRTRARGTQEVGRAATNTRCSRRCTTKVGAACHGHVVQPTMRIRKTVGQPPRQGVDSLRLG